MNDTSRQAVGTALGGLVALAAAMGIGRFAYTPILPFMAEALALGKGEAGLIASANFLGYLAGALLAASARIPGTARTVFLAALGASALTTAAMGLTASFAAFLALRFLGGAASAFVLVFSSSLILDRLAALGRPGLSSLHFAGVGCGIAASALLVAAAAGLGLDWRAQWLAGGALSLAALAVAASVVPATGASPPARPAGGARPGRAMAALIAAYGLFGFGYVITATFVSTMVRAAPEIRELETLVWLTVGLAAIPSVALWSRAAGRLGTGRAFALACAVESAGVALSALASGPAAILAAAALLGGTFMGITALGFVHARRLSAGDPRRSLALMTAAFGLGQMIGPTFAGYGFELTGSFTVPSLAAAGALALAAVLVPREAAAGAHSVGRSQP